MRFSLSNRQSTNLEDASFNASESTFRRAFHQIESIYNERDSFKGCIATSGAKAQRILELTEHLIEVFTKPASRSAAIIHSVLFPSDARLDAPVVVAINEKLKELGCSIRHQRQDLEDVKLLYESAERGYLSDQFKGENLITLPVVPSLSLLNERYRLFCSDYHVRNKFCDFEFALRGLRDICSNLHKDAEKSNLNSFKAYKISEIGLSISYCSHLLACTISETDLDTSAIANACYQPKLVGASEKRDSEGVKLIEDRSKDFLDKTLEECVAEIRLAYARLEQKLIDPMVAILMTEDNEELQDYTRILGSLRFFVDEIIQSSEKLIQYSNEFSKRNSIPDNDVFSHESTRLLRLNVNESERHNLCRDSILIVAVKLIECFELDLGKMRIKTSVNNPRWAVIEELSSSVPKIFDELSHAVLTARAIAQFSDKQVVASYLSFSLKDIL